jgi:putative phosphoesterase
MDGCDLILHAGDLSVPEVLDDLGGIAPVVAVRGDHDRLGGLALPERTVVQVAGRRIGLVHGVRGRVLDGAVITAHVVAGRTLRWRARLHASLATALGPVDCVVYGHWHQPVIERVDGVLVVSPGAVCPWGSLEGGRPPRRGLVGVGDRGVRRYRSQLGPDAMTPCVGVIEVDGSGLRPRIVPLRA